MSKIKIKTKNEFELFKPARFVWLESFVLEEEGGTEDKEERKLISRGDYVKRIAYDAVAKRPVRAGMASYESQAKSEKVEDRVFAAEAIRLIVIDGGEEKIIKEDLDLLKDLARDKSEEVRIAVAGNVCLTEEFLKLLYRDKSSKVRAAVAGNHSVPVWMLEKLSEDKVVEVRAAVAGNPSITLDMMKKLSSSKEDLKVRLAVVKNISENFFDVADYLDVLKGLFLDAELMEHFDLNAKAALAKYNEVGDDVLMRLAGDKSPLIRTLVAKNKNLEEFRVFDLARDKDPRVVWAVAERAKVSDEIFGIIVNGDCYDAMHEVLKKPDFRNKLEGCTKVKENSKLRVAVAMLDFLDADFLRTFAEQEMKYVESGEVGEEAFVVLWAIVANGSTPKDVKEKLEKYRGEIERVAGFRETLESACSRTGDEYLAYEGAMCDYFSGEEMDLDFREALVVDPDMDAGMLTYLALDKNYGIRMGVARHRNVMLNKFPFGTLSLLLTTPDYRVTKIVVNRKDSETGEYVYSLDDLEDLWGDEENFYVRFAVISRPDVGTSFLRRCFDDMLKIVRTRKGYTKDQKKRAYEVLHNIMVHSNSDGRAWLKEVGFKERKQLVSAKERWKAMVKRYRTQEYLE